MFDSVSFLQLGGVALCRRMMIIVCKGTIFLLDRVNSLPKISKNSSVLIKKQRSKKKAVSAGKKKTPGISQPPESFSLLS